MIDRNRAFRLFTKAAPVVWAILILCVSVIPVAGGNGLDGADKIGHFISYAILFVLVARAAHIQHDRSALRHKKMLITLIFGGIYGILIELLQSFIPARTMSTADILYNLAGLIAGLLITEIIWRK